MARYYLGIDGGQSSTTALIADGTGKVIGRGRAGPCNHISSDQARDRFKEVVSSCLREAVQQAGLEESTVFASACLGFSGGAGDKDSYARELIRSHRLKITHDAEIALAGGTAGAPGIVVIAGTGSMAFGRNAASRTARAGGWGYVFGDEGGAFDIVRCALRAILQLEEGWGPPTALRELLLRESGSTSANQLMHRCYADITRRDFARFAPLITRAAEEGDEVAVEIVDSAAASLTRYAAGVHSNLFETRELVPVIHIGGAFRSERLRERFSAKVLEETGCPTKPPIFSPAAGAVLDALRVDGNETQLSAVPPSEK